MSHFGTAQSDLIRGGNGIWNIKGKWQQKFISSHLKEDQKQYIEVYFKTFISGDITFISSGDILT